jgi:hypothetical protein
MDRTAPTPSSSPRWAEEPQALEQPVLQFQDEYTLEQIMSAPMATIR